MVWPLQSLCRSEANESIPELDKNRTATRKPMLGGSLFSSSSSAPPELEPLVPLQIAVSKAEVSLATVFSTSDVEYEKLTSNPAPTPPVHAARLSALLKNLASAENAVSESIKARTTLLEGLEKLMTENKAKLATEESRLTETASRKKSIDTKKREVEDDIMRHLANEDSGSPTDQASPATPAQSNGQTEPSRPIMEELTPPPVESLTPVGSPKPASATNVSDLNSFPADASSNNHSPALTGYTPQSITPQPQPGSDILSSLRMPPTTAQIPVSRDPRLRAPAAASPNNNNNTTTTTATTTTNGSAGGFTVSGSHSPEPHGHPAKKRKVAEDEFGGFGGGGGDAMEGLDEDVAALLRAESGGQ